MYVSDVYDQSSSINHDRLQIAVITNSLRARKINLPPAMVFTAVGGALYIDDTADMIS